MSKKQPEKYCSRTFEYISHNDLSDKLEGKLKKKLDKYN